MPDGAAVTLPGGNAALEDFKHGYLLRMLLPERFRYWVSVFFDGRKICAMQQNLKCKIRIARMNQEFALFTKQ